MSEIPAVPELTRRALAEKFGDGAEYRAAMWGWGLGWADCGDSVRHAIYTAAPVPLSDLERMIRPEGT